MKKVIEEFIEAIDTAQMELTIRKIVLGVVAVDNEGVARFLILNNKLIKM